MGRGSLRWVGMMVAVLTLALSACQPADRAVGTYRTSQECTANAYDFHRGPGRCVSTNGSDWTLYMPSASGPSDPGGAFAAFFVFALLWSLVPPFIGASIASKNGMSFGLAVALCIFLGWAGLVIVYFASDTNRRRSALHTIDSAFATPPPTPVGPVAGRPQSVEERLRILENLHAKGIVSDEERERRRREILDDL